MPRSRAGGVEGILVVAKPAGPTSHDIVALVRRLSATRRIGHGGTLDPFATGVLPLFLGRATRLVEYHLGADKAYRATVCFGASSTTDDLEGELTPVGPGPTRAAVETALEAFRGRIVQVPPAFSAVRIAGRRAYAMARAGEVPRPAPRTVTVTRLSVVAWDDTEPDRPIAGLEVECSAGTYVRSLARDLGAAVGGAAYLGALTRTRSGAFGLADAVPLADVRSAAADGPASFAALLRPVDAGLEAWPTVRLADDDVAAIVRGRTVGLPDPPMDAGPLRVVDPAGRLVAVGFVTGDRRLRPGKVLVDLPVPAVAS